MQHVRCLDQQDVGQADFQGEHLLQPVARRKSMRHEVVDQRPGHTEFVVAQNLAQRRVAAQRRIPGRQPQVAEDDIDVVVAVGLGAAADVETRGAVGIVVSHQRQDIAQLLPGCGPMLGLERRAPVQSTEEADERRAVLLAEREAQRIDGLGGQSAFRCPQCQDFICCGLPRRRVREQRSQQFCLRWRSQQTDQLVTPVESRLAGRVASQLAVRAIVRQRARGVGDGPLFASSRWLGKMSGKALTLAHGQLAGSAPAQVQLVRPVPVRQPLEGAAEAFCRFSRLRRIRASKAMTRVSRQLAGPVEAR